jgi:hypothetical protein
MNRHKMAMCANGFQPLARTGLKRLPKQCSAFFLGLLHASDLLMHMWSDLFRTCIGSFASTNSQQHWLCGSSMVWTMRLPMLDPMIHLWATIRGNSFPVTNSLSGWATVLWTTSGLTGQCQDVEHNIFDDAHETMAVNTIAHNWCNHPDGK